MPTISMFYGMANMNIISPSILPWLICIHPHYIHGRYSEAFFLSYPATMSPWL